MTTVFVTPEQWSGERLDLAGPVFHHLFRVSRLAVGDELRIANGDGRARGGSVESVAKGRAEVRLGEAVDSNEPDAAVELLVVAPRKPRSEWLVEKATELGVRAVRFVRSERGPRIFGKGAFERLQRIARSAAEQSERSRLPEVTGMHEWAEIPELARASEQILVLDASGKPLVARLPVRSAALLVGPEGGWSAAELDEFGGLGFTTVGLGATTLRVETAGVVAVAACLLSH